MAEESALVAGVAAVVVGPPAYLLAVLDLIPGDTFVTLAAVGT
jgi:hypothetical protein